MISPCLMSPPGCACLTAQMITSPTVATLRLNLPLLELPRRTLMHIACRAPVLSALSRYVCCWIRTDSCGRGASPMRLRLEPRVHGRGAHATELLLPLFRRLTGHHFLGRNLHG